MAKIPELSPREYWQSDEKAQSHILYIAFCEFASSCLDFATGRDLAIGKAESSARLNWASTAFYYSIVHAARFLVFLAVRDFPKSHASLANCFTANMSAKTDWLTNLQPAQTWLAERQSANVQNKKLKLTAEVNLEVLKKYWSVDVHWPDGTDFLFWMGKVLSKAKELRNDNNYEALLIANEFQHRRMTEVFRKLCETMEETSRKALLKTSRAFSAYLSCDVSDSFEWPSPDKTGFVREYVNERVIDATQTWFGRKIAQEVTDMLAPITALHHIEGNASSVRQIEKDVRIKMFGEKESLMRSFEDKIYALANVTQVI